MLKVLNIINLALVNHVEIEFEPGLNILTGETGSGKSILVDALGLVLGGRSSPDVIRSGEEKACVEAVFHLPRRTEFAALCEEHGFTIDLDEVLIRREITAQGRGRVFVNDQLATVHFLKLIRPYLVDIHGQGDQQSLLQPATHGAVLDGFGGLEERVSVVRSAYQEWTEARREIESSRQEESERLRQLDFLTFQCQEIESAAITSMDEDTDLEAERHRLSNAERLAALAWGGYQGLYEEETAVVSLLGGIQRRIEDLETLDPQVSESVAGLHSARYMLEDVAFFLRDYAERVRFSPERLKQVEDRLQELGRLKRKYGPTLENVLETYESARRQLLRLGDGEMYMHRLEERARAAADRFRLGAEELSRERREAAAKLERELMEELKYLAMEGTRVRVDIRRIPVDEPDRWRATGVDEVEFLMSSNLGEEVRSLTRVASGGEISRFMLALKTILAPTEFPRTLVFDEVDVGISGRVAEAVGQRLKRLGDFQQILCVTHLPQIARFGKVHYVVHKDVVAGRTETFVTRLTKQHRVEELARMIGGASVTEAARRAAREMLSDR